MSSLQSFPNWFDPFIPHFPNPLHEGLSERQIEKLEEAGRERLQTGDITGGLWAVSSDPEFEKKRLEGISRYQLKLREKRIQRQNRAIELLEFGYRTEEACWHINITQQTFYNWCSKDKDFALRVKEAQRKGAKLISSVDRSNAHSMPFHILRKRCLGRDTYDFQQKIIDIIENAPIGEVTMILLPPGVGKTMTLEDWLTIELAKDQTLRCLYISETSDLGERTLGVIKSRFENEDGEFNELAEMFGPLYDKDNGKRWTANEISMPLSDSSQRDYSLRSRGMNSQIYSIRADIIVLDDIQTTNTLGSTDKFLRNLRRTIFSRREGAIKGKIVYIGTRLEVGDLPSRMIKEGIVLEENLFVMPLINSEGVSNFEEVIATSSLPIIVRQQAEEFQGVYQQNPAGGKNNTFKDAVPRALKKKETISTWNEVHEAHGQKILGRIVSIDPALTGGNAVMALGWTMTDVFIYDLDFQFNINKMSKIEDIIENFVLAYQATDLIIEDKAFQKALFTSEGIERICSTYGVKLHPHTTGSEKHDETFGVAKMEGPMSFGKIHIPYGDAISRSTMTPLVEQLQAWRPDLPTKAITQDTIMALWFAYVYIYKQRGIIASSNRAEEVKKRSMELHGIRPRGGLPGGKTSYTTTRRPHHR